MLRVGSSAARRVTRLQDIMELKHHILSPSFFPHIFLGKLVYIEPTDFADSN